MKKYLLYIFTLVSFLSLFNCKEITKNQNTNTENDVRFRIDPRTEFFRTAFNLAKQDSLDEDIKPCKTEYLKRIDNHFLKFKNHPLIDYIRKHNTIGIDFSTLGLMYDNLETFKFDTLYKKELEPLGLTSNSIDSLKPLLVDFYKKSEFKDFFKQNESYYKKAIALIEKQVSDENLFDKLSSFYQSNQKNLELVVCVELTNNANNKAIDFFDRYNPNKRALILANICEMPEQVTKANTIMTLDNSIRGILYHETSHLFTSQLLKNHLKNLNQYKSICEGCTDIQLTDKIDHMIIVPLQAILMERLNNDNTGKIFFLEKCKDVRKDIYKRLKQYQPNGKTPFEEVYKDCINIITQEVS